LQAPQSGGTEGSSSSSCLGWHWRITKQGDLYTDWYNKSSSAWASWLCGSWDWYCLWVFRILLRLLFPATSRWNAGMKMKERKGIKKIAHW